MLPITALSAQASAPSSGTLAISQHHLMHSGVVSAGAEVAASSENECYQAWLCQHPHRPPAPAPGCHDLQQQGQGPRLRAAINTPIQGSAADVATAAMLAIGRHQRLRELGWTLLLQVGHIHCLMRSHIIIGGTIIIIKLARKTGLACPAYVGCAGVPAPLTWLGLEMPSVQRHNFLSCTCRTQQLLLATGCQQQLQLLR